MWNVYTDEPFFSSHFYLGHRKFETGEPELFLFGDLQDINYLPAKPVKVNLVYKFCSVLQCVFGLVL